MNIQLSKDWKTGGVPNDYDLLLLMIEKRPIPILGTYYAGEFVQVKSGQSSTSFSPIRGKVVAWRSGLGVAQRIVKDELGEN